MNHKKVYGRSKIFFEAYFIILYFHELTHFLLKLANKNEILDPFITPQKEI